MSVLCILGMGYIGLPTAVMFSSRGMNVVGVDISPRIVASLNQGKILIEEPGLDVAVAKAVADGNLRAQTTPVEADAYIIAVPTPIREDHTADMRAVEAAARSLIPYIRKGCLVILESTSPPGTTKDLVRPILEESGLKAGTDFHLCFSPERVLPGRILTELVENDRVVGGITPEAAEAGKALYGKFVKGEITTTDSTTAEMVKVMENTFRDVNIALANEFALISEKLGINVWEAIAMANHHPRVKVLQPGPGVGGHCIAVDPWFLVEAAPEEAKLIRQARLINDNMPQHVMSLVRAALPTGTPETHTIACFGLTFKPDVDDTRESPALHIAQMLVRAGYHVRVFDPHVTENPGLSGTLSSTIEDALDSAHLMLILVNHSEFKSLSPANAQGMSEKNVIDTRNLLNAKDWREAGYKVRVIGSVKA